VELRANFVELCVRLITLPLTARMNGFATKPAPQRQPQEPKILTSTDTTVFAQASADWGTTMPVVAVIDDEPMIRDLVEDCLRQAGYEAHSATSAEAGAKLLASRHCDLALIDVLLQDNSGIRLAQIAADQNTPVVLMTGHVETALRLRQFDFPHMLKPFKAAELTEAVALVIADRHRNVQRLTDGLARLRANLAGLDMATTRPRRSLATTGKSEPDPTSPSRRQTSG
jgi:CheY-like chemotaxis protein